MAMNNTGSSANNFQIDAAAATSTDEVRAQGCPRCGAPQPRKAKPSVCDTCKRFVPSELARQHWKPQQKILYPEIESILAQNDEDEPAEVNFKKSRRSHDVVRSFRTIGGVIVVMAVTSYYATPAALKFTMGEVGYKKLEASANQTVKKILKPQSQPRKVSSRIDTKRL